VNDSINELIRTRGISVSRVEYDLIISKNEVWINFAIDDNINDPIIIHRGPSKQKMATEDYERAKQSFINKNAGRQMKEDDLGLYWEEENPQSKTDNLGLLIDLIQKNAIAQNIASQIC
jgi:hypothetical protein